MRSSREWNDHELGRAFTLDDAPGPARPIDRGAEAAIVMAALVGAGFATPPPIGGGSGGGGASGVPGASGVSGIAKLAIVIGGGAAVTTAAIVAWMAIRAPREDVIGTGTEKAEKGAVVEPSSTSTTDTPLPVVESPAVIVHVDKPSFDSAPPAPRSGRTVRTPMPEPEPAPVVVQAPEDLLAEANAARAAHEWSKADVIYAKVAAMPNALAAETALVADAQIHLEHLGDAAGAAKRFRKAIAANPRGALAEDARWGLAEASRALGDAKAEQAALDDFLAHHADSPLASRARARAAELEK